MRLLQGLIAMLFVLAGALFSALNPGTVGLDFYFFSGSSSLGVALLGALLLGTLLGGVVVSTTVLWPLKRRLHKLQRQADAGTRKAPAAP